MPRSGTGIRLLGLKISPFAAMFSMSTLATEVRTGTGADAVFIKRRGCPMSPTVILLCAPFSWCTAVESRLTGRLWRKLIERRGLRRSAATITGVGV